MKPTDIMKPFDYLRSVENPITKDQLARMDRGDFGYVEAIEQIAVLAIYKVEQLELEVSYLKSGEQFQLDKAKQLRAREREVQLREQHIIQNYFLRNRILELERDNARLAGYFMS